MRSKAITTDQDFYLHLFNYTPCDGVLRWNNPPKQNPYLKGKIAGNKNSDGYIQIRLNRKNYLAHRIVWVIERGFDAEMLDHINGDRSDNRIVNLRTCDNRSNQVNQKRHREGSLPGATYCKNYGKWWARVKVKGKSIHLGYFDTEIEAHVTYTKALKVFEL